MPGFSWIIPVVDKIVLVNITEQMVDAQPQEIITNDNLNAKVDAQVYFKVKDDEQSVKSSQYNVNNYQRQVVKAENEKIAALDFANAAEREATASSARRSRRPRASSRPTSCERRVKPRRSDWSTRRPIATSSATPSC